MKFLSVGVGSGCYAQPGMGFPVARTPPVRASNPDLIRCEEFRRRCLRGLHQHSIRSKMALASSSAWREVGSGYFRLRRDLVELYWQWENDLRVMTGNGRQTPESLDERPVSIARCVTR